MLTEIDAAQERQKRADDMVISGAWLTAILQRQKKVPKLEKLLARGAKPDMRMYLDMLKAQLPGITMDDWRRRVAAREAD